MLQRGGVEELAGNRAPDGVSRQIEPLEAGQTSKVSRESLVHLQYTDMDTLDELWNMVQEQPGLSNGRGLSLQEGHTKQAGLAGETDDMGYGLSWNKAAATADRGC